MHKCVFYKYFKFRMQFERDWPLAQYRGIYSVGSTTALQELFGVGKVWKYFFARSYFTIEGWWMIVTTVLSYIVLGIDCELFGALQSIILKKSVNKSLFICLFIISQKFSFIIVNYLLYQIAYLALEGVYRSHRCYITALCNIYYGRRLKACLSINTALVLSLLCKIVRVM